MAPRPSFSVIEAMAAGNQGRQGRSGDGVSQAQEFQLDGEGLPESGSSSVVIVVGVG
jgi:hypothetical protein